MMCTGCGVPYRKRHLMGARHGPPHVGTMIWANRAALGAGGRNGTNG
jgi:hypothetical protein